jgi:hypothetical protein
VRATDPATGRLISPIVAAALCVKPRGLLSDNQAAKVDALKSCWPDFAAIRQLAMRFRGLPRSKHRIYERPVVQFHRPTHPAAASQRIER